MSIFVLSSKCEGVAVLAFPTSIYYYPPFHRVVYVSACATFLELEEESVYGRYVHFSYLGEGAYMHSPHSMSVNGQTGAAGALIPCSVPSSLLSGLWALLEGFSPQVPSLDRFSES